MFSDLTFEKAKPLSHSEKKGHTPSVRLGKAFIYVSGVIRGEQAHPAAGMDLDSGLSLTVFSETH